MEGGGSRRGDRLGQTVSQSDARPFRRSKSARSTKWRISPERRRRSPSADPAASRRASCAQQFGLCSARGAERAMSKGSMPAKTVSFVSQKGGVGKSALARLFAVGAAHRGLQGAARRLRPRAAHLRRVERGAAAAAIEPEIDARAFKSLKKLRKDDQRGRLHRRRHARPRRRPDQGARRGKRRRVPADRHLARRPAPDAGARPQTRQARRRRAHRRRPVQGRPLGGRSSPRASRRSPKRDSSCCREQWPLRDGFQADLDAGRAGREARNPTCAKSPSGWKKR